MTKYQRTKLKHALKNFKQGDFPEAKREFSELQPELPDNKTAVIYSGYLALLENRLPDAAEGLQKALQLMPGSKAVKSLLTDVYYRQDNFAKASYLMKSINRKCQAAKLDYLKERRVYEVSSTVRITELEFIEMDPLPLVSIRINGASPVNFFIDTGGSELLINIQYARTLGLKEFGMEKQLFGGGKTGAVIHSCIDTLQLGDFQVKNLPVMLLDSPLFTGGLYGDRYKVDGILGTCLFYHFLTTLDYKNNKIVFEIINSDTNNLLADRLKTKAFECIPFWMAGDHFILAKGKINSSKDMIFFIDTGLGGNAFTCPKSTLKKCGFTLIKDSSGSGAVGGGNIKVTPFTIDHLSMSEVHRENLSGLYGAFPPSIERMFGFHIGGLISHEFFKSFSVTFDFTAMKLYIC